MSVTLLSLYQSPVNCWSRNVKDNFTQKVNYCYYCHFVGVVIYTAIWTSTGLAFYQKSRWLNSLNTLLLGKPYWNRRLAMSL